MASPQTPVPVVQPPCLEGVGRRPSGVPMGQGEESKLPLLTKGGFAP